jgi:Zn-finger nucleic acid-binding protein
MNCPKCDGTELTAVSMSIEDHSRPGSQTAALEIDQCASCDGIWFDAGEVEKYYAAGIKALQVPKTAAASDAELDAKTGRCPRCAIALAHAASRFNAGVTVDACPGCGGTWIDGAELAKVGGEALPFGDKMKSFFGDVKPGGR